MEYLDLKIETFLNEIIKKIRNYMVQENTSISNLDTKVIDEIVCELAFENVIDYYNRKFHPSLISFKNFFNSKKNIKTFFNEYNFLYVDIKNRINDYKKEHQKILKQLKKDKDKLRNFFDIDIKNLNKINIGLGDWHDGEAVALLYFKDKKLVYKPQNCNQYQVLQELLTIFTKNSNRTLKFKLPKVLTNDDYSWIEFIKTNYSRCSQNSLNNLYVKFGYYLMAFYILGSTDLHYENVIINNNNPYFIDFETFSSLPKNDWNVLKTGLLPNPKTKQLDINLSALFNNGSRSTMLKKDIIDFSKKEGFVFSKGDYLFKPNLQIPEDTNSINNLIIGFKEAGNIISSSKEKVYNLMKNVLSNEYCFRIVLRNTSVYAEFLDAIRHPNIRLNLEKRAKILLLLSRTDDSKVGENEMYILSKGWIPRYYLSNKNNQLINISKDIISTTLFKNNMTINESILQRIRSLDTNIIKKQTRLIQLSYLLTHFDISKPLTNHEKSTYITDVLDNYIEHIDELGIIFENKNEINIGYSYPGLLNFSGWLIVIAKYRPQFLSLKKVISIYKKLLTANKKQKIRDDSLLTGWAGMEYARKIVTSHTNEKIYSVPFKFNKTNQKINDAINFMKNVPLNQNVTNSPYLTGALAYVFK